MANNKKSEQSNDKPESSKKNTKISKNIIGVEKSGLNNIINLEINKTIIEKKIKSNFKPSIKMLIRIMSSMTETGSKSKTNLSHGTNLNYTRLAKHIVWLEKRGLVRSTVKNSKIKIDLTDEGRVFATTITTVLGDTK